MSLSHAILGFLARQPMTGYDLKTRCFDESVAHFWTADQAQIYRTLDRLTEQGHVESSVEIQHDRPNRKVYSLTPAGRDELHRWLLTDQAALVYREPFLIQLFFADMLTRADVLRLIDHQAALHRARMATYEAIPMPPLSQPDLPDAWLYSRMTLELGIRIEAAYLDWLAAMRRVVAARDSDADGV